MKVCLVGPVAPWRGGIAQYLDALGRAFVNQQEAWNDNLSVNKHIIIAWSFKRQYPKFLRRYQKDGSRAKLPNVFYELDVLNPISWYRSVRSLRRYNFDLVIFKYWHPYFALPFGYIARKLSRDRVKICFIVDNVYPHEWFPFKKFLAKYVLSAGDCFITHSRKVSDDLAGILPCAFSNQVPHPAFPVAHLPIAKDRALDELAKHGVIGSKRIVLFWGYIRPYKGLDVLIKAFALVKAWFPDALLLIAGECQEDWKKYWRLIGAELNYQGVIWLNKFNKDQAYISDAMLPILFCGADLLVLPYKTTTQSGIVELARGYDIPIISTWVGGLPEQVECVVPPNNPVVLAQTMVRFFTDSVKCGYKPTITFEQLAEKIETIHRDHVGKKFVDGFNRAMKFRWMGE